jgi:hypothetical protein
MKFPRESSGLLLVIICALLLFAVMPIVGSFLPSWLSSMLLFLIIAAGMIGQLDFIQIIDVLPKNRDHNK